VWTPHLGKDSKSCVYMRVYVFLCVLCVSVHVCACVMGWLRLVGSLKWQVSFAKEPYKRDDILQKRPIILRSLLIVATPYVCVCARVHVCVYVCVCACVFTFVCVCFMSMTVSGHGVVSDTIYCSVDPLVCLVWCLSLCVCIFVRVCVMSMSISGHGVVSDVVNCILWCACVCFCLFVWVCVCVCLSVCLYVCVCVCVCIMCLWVNRASSRI